MFKFKFSLSLVKFCQPFFFLTSIQFLAYAMRENLSNRFSGIQITPDICTRFWRYLYSARHSWLIKADIYSKLTADKMGSSEYHNALWEEQNHPTPHSWR